MWHPQDKTTLVCALADGQGGQFGGALAARVAVERSLKLATAFSPDALLDQANWLAIVSGADETVSETAAAGYATLIGVCVAQNRIVGASCGDGAALLVEPFRWLELTRHQRKNPPLGSGGAWPIAFDAALQADSRLLMMSDGVWKGLTFDSIAAVSRAHQIDEIVAALRQRQFDGNGGKLSDDFSLIVASS